MRQRVELVRQRAAGGHRQVDDVGAAAAAASSPAAPSPGRSRPASSADPDVQDRGARRDAGVRPARRRTVARGDAGDERAVAVGVEGLAGRPAAGHVDVAARGRRGRRLSATPVSTTAIVTPAPCRPARPRPSASRTAVAVAVRARDRLAGELHRAVGDDAVRRASTVPTGRSALTPPASGSRSRTVPPAARTASADGRGAGRARGDHHVGEARGRRAGCCGAGGGADRGQQRRGGQRQAPAAARRAGWSSSCSSCRPRVLLHRHRGSACATGVASARRLGGIGGLRGPRPPHDRVRRGPVVASGPPPRPRDLQERPCPHRPRPVEPAVPHPCAWTVPPTASCC